MCHVSLMYHGGLCSYGTICDEKENSQQRLKPFDNKCKCAKMVQILLLIDLLCLVFFAKIHSLLLFAKIPSSGNKRYTFETSIDTTRLTPCCSLLFGYNSMLLIVECLKWEMQVRCECQCVSDLGLLQCSFCCLNWCSICKNVTY